MKTQLATGGKVAGTAQPASSLALSHGIAGQRLATGIRCARVTDMNRSADMQTTEREDVVI